MFDGEIWPVGAPGDFTLGKWAGGCDDPPVCCCRPVCGAACGFSLSFALPEFSATTPGDDVCVTDEAGVAVVSGSRVCWSVVLAVPVVIGCSVTFWGSPKDDELDEGCGAAVSPAWMFVTSDNDKLGVPGAIETALAAEGDD